jgi:hypothetical protein
MAIQAYISASEQGVAVIGGQSDWSTARDDAGDLASYNEYNTATTVGNAISVFGNSGRGSYLYEIDRTFLVFDVSSITSAGTITNIDLEISGSTNNNANVIVVAAGAFGGGGGGGSFTSPDWSSWNPDSPTDYSSTFNSWATSGYNSITLNNTAVTASNNNGYLNLAIVEKDYDYDNVDVQGPFPGGASFNNGAVFRQGSTPSVHSVRLDITYLASGYGNDVNGVASANIGAVNGVLTANISKVNGV